MQTLAQALNAASFPPVSVSYFDHQLPSFSLPPADLNQLRILHGSCRKAHGGEADILPFIDTLIEQHCTQANTRPHQLFFTGDQIYGDDVADPLLMALTDAGETLLGWQEELPIDASNPVRLKQLYPGQRSQIAEESGGFTAGLQGKEKLAKSHLFGLGEYCAAYLLVWSQVLWTEFPAGQVVYPQRKAAKAWNQEVNALQNLAHTLWRVRRLLANVPTYMIFDDHDISDDWYLNRHWCERVLGRKLGRRTVLNGLLAYALFQGWGNTPEQFEPGQSGAVLLEAAAAWSVSRGTDSTIEATIARYLGLPDTDPATGLPKFCQDGKTLILDRHPVALQWDYVVRGSQHEVVVLDTRTWRGYPVNEAAEAPPMLLSQTAFDRQLRQPLQPTDRRNPEIQTTIKATLVIAPTNLVSLKAIDWVQHWNLRQGKVFHNDVGDAWNINKYAFSKLLRTLFEQRDRVVVLSGDIHYGSAVCLHYWLRQSSDPDSPEAARVLAQLTSSAIKNTEFKTRIVHTKIKSLVPEWSQDWAGWDTPPELLGVRSILGFRRVSPIPQSTHAPMIRRLHQIPGQARFAWNIAVSHPRHLPHWRYHVDWISRQPAQMVYERLKPTAPPQGGLKRILDGFQMLWTNRWLQDGKEVVGLNNIGLVQFEWVEAADRFTVTQDLYWYAPWRSDAVVSSQFRVPLQLEEPPVHIPVVEKPKSP
ncbi:PhoD-like phosphatase [Egbenema bharatensis]|uniref:PhoD-like phosphatase n=1 Tax=Egbenema bharatensis TaxID=3463334 RepID=UPI003A86A1D7